MPTEREGPQRQRFEEYVEGRQPAMSGVTPATFSRLVSVSVKPVGVETPITTAAIDTTGVKLLVAFMGRAPSSTGNTFTDSKGNTWIAATERTLGSSEIQAYYCINPTVGTGHTFTAAGTTNFGSLAILGYTSDGEIVYEAETGLAANTTLTVQPGAILPAFDNGLLVTGASTADAVTLSINQSFDLVEQRATAGNYGIYAAEQIQTTATSRNPTWTASGSTSIASAMLAFRTSAGFFQDDFNDNSIDAAKWPTVQQTGGAALAETANRIEVTPVASTLGYGILISDLKDFTGAFAEVDFVQVVGGDTVTGGTDHYLMVRLDASNYILIGKNNTGASGVIFRVRTGGVNNDSTFGGFGNARWRIRMVGTSCICEEWDGSTYVLRSTKTVSWSLASVEIRLVAGYYDGSNASVQKGIWDRFLTSIPEE